MKTPTRGRDGGRVSPAPDVVGADSSASVDRLRMLARVVDLVIDAIAWLAHGVGRLMHSLARSLDQRLPSPRLVGAPSKAWGWATQLLRLRRDVLTNPSTIGMRRLALTGVIVNVFIVSSGGLVRLTKSGLGCPTWPRCTESSLLPQAHTDIPASRMLIEFGNRMVTFAVLAVAILVFVAALHLRAQRPDLVRLAVLQPLGVLSQIVLGGITVLTGLNPASVGAHYLLSALVIVACVALHVRAIEGDRPARRTLPPPAYRLAVTLPILGFLLLAAGTVVTGAGPHAGDESAPRYTFLGIDTIATVAKVHSGVMWLTVALAVALTIAARRAGATVAVHRAYVLLGVIVFQGTIGYVQYATGVPERLVFFHVLGSAVFWVALLYVRFAARSRGLAEPVIGEAPGSSV